MNLKGTTALVTGANRGLGLNFVEALVEFGAAKIYAAARNIDTLSPLVSRFENVIVPIALDVTDQEQVDAAVAAAPDITLLLNNAGTLDQHGLLEASDLTGFEHEMAVNVYGLARMCRAFSPVIERNGGGGITNMLSVASMVNFPPFGTYAATKAAAMSLTDCLRFEMRDKGVEVFGVYAGYIDTGMLGNVDADKTSPAEIARATMLGMEAGIINIDTDERSRMVRAGLRADPDAVRTVTWERAIDFREHNPAN